MDIDGQTAMDLSQSGNVTLKDMEWFEREKLVQSTTVTFSFVKQ